MKKYKKPQIKSYNLDALYQEVNLLLKKDERSIITVPAKLIMDLLNAILMKKQ